MVQVSWHRGGKEFAPSATKAAFAAAARAGAEWIEVDVRASADGVLVCVHDPSVDGLGDVSTLEWATLSDDDRARILTFDQFLDVLDDADPDRCVTGVHLDLKDEGYEIAAVDAVVGRGRALFATTSIANSVARIRRARPHVDAYLTIGTSRAGLSRRALVRLRASEIFPMWRIARTRATGVAVHHALATNLLRAWCRYRSLAVVVWTVDRDDRLDRWLASDVDVVTTNRPVHALARRREMARTTPGG